MNDLYSLIQGLDKSQLQIIRTSLVCFSSRKQADTKGLQLFEYLLEQDSPPSAADCCSMLYGFSKDPRFMMLRSRLKHKVSDALLLDVNIKKTEYLDEADQATILVTKKWAQCNYLYRTIGDNPIVYELIEEIIKLSKEYELYSILIVCLQFKKYTRSFANGVNYFNRLNKEIQNYEYCNKAVYKSADYYFSLITCNDFHITANKNSYQDMIKDAVIDLNKDYKITKSAYVMFNIKQLEMEYYINEEEYVSARDVCVEMLHLVRNNKAVYQKQRVGIAYDDLANCDILLGEFDKAIENVRMAQKYLPAMSYNYNASREIEFYALFYSENMNEASQVIEKLLKSLPNLDNDFRLAKYGFLQANVYFKNGNYREALKNTKQLQELTKDKIGWNVSLRILSIMSLLEMGKCDEASIQVENLGKHMKRQSKTSELKERDFKILSFLMSVEKKGFERDELDEKQLQLLEMLNGSDKKYKWEKVSPEIIPFQEWALSYFDTKNIVRNVLIEKSRTHIKIHSRVKKIRPPRHKDTKISQRNMV